MTNGCPKCEKLEFGQICIDCQLEQADADVLKAMNRYAELQKRKIIEIAHQTKQELKKKKEQEHAKL